MTDWPILHLWPTIRPFATVLQRGLGRALIEAILARMGTWGHPTIRLDTAVFLKDAIALYRQMGFVEIEPYTSLPPDTDKTAVFMELRR